jgi:murein L,D-transpeptidase YafK
MRLSPTLFGLALLGIVAVSASPVRAQLPHFTPLQADMVVVHKERRLLELKRDGRTIRSFRIALGSDPVGPKRMEGDGRTPEGVYTLDWRNEQSSFYRSMHVSYPQPWDYERAVRWGVSPGDLIMIHGLPNDAAGPAAASHPTVDWTNGCIAVTNEEMDEIWDRVQDGTPIIIYP